MTDTMTKPGYEGEGAMLDKVARAICGASCFRARILGEPCLNDDRTNGPCKANATQLELGGPMDAARRAVEALKDPDADTVEAMAKAVYLSEYGNDTAYPTEPKRFRDSLSAESQTAFNAGLHHILKGGEA